MYSQVHQISQCASYAQDKQPHVSNSVRRVCLYLFMDLKLATLGIPAGNSSS